MDQLHSHARKRFEELGRELFVVTVSVVHSWRWLEWNHFWLPAYQVNLL
jgi:hypothetical protein